MKQLKYCRSFVVMGGEERILIYEEEVCETCFQLKEYDDH